MRRVGCTVLFALAACKGGGEEEDPGPLDVRIDQAGPEDETAVESTHTRMCVNDEGRISVVWQDAREGNEAIWLNQSTDLGASWLTGAVRVSNGDMASTAPEIACTNSRVFVVWEDDRDGELENHNIYLARSGDNGETWADEVAIDADPDGDHMSLGPQIAAVGNDVYVAWFDAAHGAYDIFVAASHDGGETFGAPVRVDGGEEGEAYSAWPRIVAESGGVVYVAWEDSRDGLSDVYFAASYDGGRTFSERRLDVGDDPGAADSFSPRLAAADGVVYVVWHDDRSGVGKDVFMNFSEDSGETWASGAIRVDSDNEGHFDSLYPDVKVFDGTAHIAWQDARNVGFDVYYRSAVGADFTGEEVRLDSDAKGTANSIDARVAVGDQGGATVAWQDRRDDATGAGYGDLYYNYTTEGSWNDTDLRIDRVVSGSKFVRDLNVHVHARSLLAAWTDGRNGTADVFFHTMALGEESPIVSPGEGSE
jgi:hypothetical protein